MSQDDLMPENLGDQTPRSERSIRAVAEVGLPELTGSEQDVEAARETRARLLVEADDLLTEMRTNHILTEEQKDTAITVAQPITHAQVVQAQIALDRLRHKMEASWWLAHKNDGAAALLAAFAVNPNF